MHDNAFNEFVSYLQQNKLLNGNEIGNFISLENEFYIFDIAFYQKLFEQNGFVSCLKDIQKNNIQTKTAEQVQEMSREQRRDISNAISAYFIGIITVSTFNTFNLIIFHRSHIVSH